MKIKYLSLLIVLLSTSFVSCIDRGNGISGCDHEVIISASQYESAPNDPLTINSFEINDDCLELEFGASGCDGNTWVIELIDATVIMESCPPQRNIRLSLKNEEECEAYITKTLSFDISALQVGGGQVLLNLTNSNQQISYEY